MRGGSKPGTRDKMKKAHAGLQRYAEINRTMPKPTPEELLELAMECQERRIMYEQELARARDQYWNRLRRAQAEIGRFCIEKHAEGFQTKVLQKAFNIHHNTYYFWISMAEDGIRSRRTPRRRKRDPESG